MNHDLIRSVRFLIAIAFSLVVALPVDPALGQSGSPTQVTIDAPTEGERIGNGNVVNVGGWAVDPAGPGTGVDAVRVYLDERMGAGGQLLGMATYGEPRFDVASTLGNPAYAYSGFNFTWTPSSLMPGNHTLYVYAHSIMNGWAYSTVTVTVQGRPTVLPGLPGPPPRMIPPGPYPYPTNPYLPGYPYPPPGAQPRPDRVCIMIYPPPPGC